MHYNNLGNFYTREIYAITIPFGFMPIPIPIMSRMAIPIPMGFHGNGIPMGFPTPMHTSSVAATGLVGWWTVMQHGIIDDRSSVARSSLSECDACGRYSNYLL